MKIKRHYVVALAMLAFGGLWLWLDEWAKVGPVFAVDFSGELIHSNGQSYIEMNVTNISKRNLQLKQIGKANGLTGFRPAIQWNEASVVSGDRDEIRPGGGFVMLVHVDPEVETFTLTFNVAKEVFTLGRERRWSGGRDVVYGCQPKYWERTP
ncbi:MAG: hypothetical protein U1G08_18880 [Verrucomicrobiota bacterium]